MLEPVAQGILGGLVALLIWAALWGSLGLLSIVIERAYRFVSSRIASYNAAQHVTDGRPSYSLSLLVRLDEESGRLAPGVQVRGERKLSRPWIRLELMDERGRLRHVATKRIRRWRAINELALPAFGLPDGVRPEQALGWHWDVVLGDADGERARWREHPRRAGVLNAEAELA